MNAVVTIAAAYAIDRVLGEPPTAIHPVAWMGRAIGAGRDWALRAGKLGQLARGAVVALALPSASAVAAAAIVRALGRYPPVALAAAAIVLKTMFAARALRDAAFRVRDALDRGDVAGARQGLASLCSRSADGLDRRALVAATIESVAENAADSIVGPLLFFACFGVAGAAFYRCANTGDAMIGYRGRLEYAGKAAARLDDLLNLVPARLTAALLLAAGTLSGCDVRRGLAILRRDGGRTESPNAGRPMAAMAGLLGVRLEKKGHYALGDDAVTLETAHITRAWQIVSAASLGAAAICAGLAEMIHG